MPAIRPGSKGGVISGWGTALPEKVLTNHELAEMMDTSDEWIVTRTGIHERRVGGTTIGLSVEAGRQAIEMAGLDPKRIDAVVLATTTPDKQWGNAAAVQTRARDALRRVRRQRRLLGLRVRARHGPRTDRDGCRPGAGDRHRHPVAHRRLGRPRHRSAVRRRLRRGRDRVGRRARAAARLGSRRRRLAAVDPAGRGRRLHPHGGQGGLPPRRSGSWSTRPRSRWRTPASPPTTSP